MARKAKRPKTRNTKTKEPMTMLTFRVSVADRDRLDALADRLGVSRSDVARMALLSGADALERATKGKRTAAGILGAVTRTEDGPP